MSSVDRATQIADLFTEAGEAHHQAYLATDGEDPEWPIWYAGYVKDRLNEILDAGFTQSEIVHHLVAADREGGPGPWQMSYAARLVDATS